MRLITKNQIVIIFINVDNCLIYFICVVYLGLLLSKIKLIVNNNNNNKLFISPIQYIGNIHPYKMFYIINLCISSSLFISNYTIAKTSIFLYIIYIINNNIYLLIIILFFIIYPLLFIILIHPFIVTSINNNIINKSISKGININNIVIILLTFITLFNLYIFFILFLLPFISFIKYLF